MKAILYVGFTVVAVFSLLTLIACSDDPDGPEDGFVEYAISVEPEVQSIGASESLHAYAGWEVILEANPNSSKTPTNYTFDAMNDGTVVESNTSGKYRYAYANAGSYTAKITITYSDSTTEEQMVSVVIDEPLTTWESEVLIEVISTDNCGPCYAAELDFETMMDSRILSKGITAAETEKVNLAYIHFRDNIDVEEQENRILYWYPDDFLGTPSILFNGTRFTEVGSSAKYLSTFVEAMSEEPQVLAFLNGSVDTSGENITVQFDGTIIPRVELTNGIDVQFWFLESNIHYSASNGQTYFDHVVKKMVDGDDASSFGKSFNYTFTAEDLNTAKGFQVVLELPDDVDPTHTVGGILIAEDTTDKVVFNSDSIDGLSLQ